MRLIDEIKARLEHDPPGQEASCRACELLDRLRAALLAGEEMAKHLSIDPWKEDDDVQAMLARFRAATEGTDAAAIGRAS